MAITFACECGKQMQAKDEFAGRRMKCPACQRVVTIPGAVAAPGPATPAASPVEMPALVPVASGGRSALPAAVANSCKPRSARLAGRCAVRPAARWSPSPRRDDDAVPVGEAETPFLVRLVRPKLNVWADRSLEQPITPWRGDDARRFDPAGWEGRDRRSDRRRLVLVVLLLLIGGVAAAAWYFREEVAQYVQARDSGAVQTAHNWGRFSDLDLLPRSASGLLSVRVADWWDSKAGQTSAPRSRSWATWKRRRGSGRAWCQDRSSG